MQGCRVEMVSGEACLVFDYQPDMRIDVVVAGCGQQYVTLDDIVLDELDKPAFFSPPGMNKGFSFS